MWKREKIELIRYVVKDLDMAEFQIMRHLSDGKPKDAYQVWKTYKDSLPPFDHYASVSTWALTTGRAP